jgi:DeoR/GlpR family transcriptional regulator of sugar metabolism
MLKKERQAFIIQQINIHNKVLCTDLGLQLNVSEDTVRRDLQELAEEGKLIKVHGGALSKSFHFTIERNNVYSLSEKQIIARKVVPLIKDGMLVVISGGTTIRELVKILPADLNATFVTTNVPIALELLDHPNIEVIFLGNRLLKSAQMAVGAEVVQRLGQIKADLCLLGTNSIQSDDWMCSKNRFSGNFKKIK